jgi:protein arginine N-methyltransferase 1
MHPVTRFLDYLKRKRVSLALARAHLTDRDLAAWYPDWMYEVMENDEVRNRAYRDVIRQTVAGKVVLEVGAGRKARWAVCCARAGARKVYAIEANRRACQAARRFLQSRRIDNVELLYGFSDRVRLPERCDVLVHSLAGDIGSCEGMVRFVEDAKRRLLTPGALHIPERCTTYVVLAEDPKLRLADRVLSRALRGLRPFEGLSFVWFFGFPHAAALSEPHVFEDVVFRESPRLRTDTRLAMEITRDGELRGACFFIRLHVGATRVVDSWASQTAWSTPYVRLAAPAPVRKGDVVEMSIQSDLSGNPSYSIELTHHAEGAVKEVGRYAWAGD